MNRRGDYLFISLSRGQAAKVDHDDFDWLNKWNWFAHWNPGMNQFYATRGETISGKQYVIGMHRDIMGLRPGNKLHVDHINHDCLDNRRSNLRIVPAGINILNAKTRRDNTTGIRGVSWDKWKQKYTVRIRIHGKLYAWYVSDPIEGGKLYEAKRKEALDAYSTQE